MNAIKNVPNQGWQIKSEVRTSNIPQAGLGRFAAEPIKTGTAVIAKPLKPMATIDALAPLDNDITITMASVADLEKYIELAQKEGGCTVAEIQELFAHFIYGFDGKVGCLNVSTWTVNHGDAAPGGTEENVLVLEKKLPSGEIALVGDATGEIKVGEELYMDYRKFKLPQWYLEYCVKHGLTDVRTTTVSAVYGATAAVLERETPWQSAAAA
jgi:hypothetical protein